MAKQNLSCLLFSLMFLQVSCVVFAGPGQSEEEEEECAIPPDCGAGWDCVERAGRMTCVRIECSEDSHCAAHERCYLDARLCGTTCDNHIELLCADNELCVTEDNGAKCVDRADLTPADHCILSPSQLVVQEGTRLQLRAALYDQENRLLPHPESVFVGEGLAGIDISQDGVLQVHSISQETQTFVEAHHRGQVVCHAPIKALPSVQPGWFRVVPIHAHTGETIANATVVLRLQTPQQEQQNLQLAETTSGIYRVEVPAQQRLLDVSVYAEGFDFVTVLEPSQDSLILSLLPSQPEHQVSGTTVEFDASALPRAGEIKTGFTWLSPESLGDGYGLFALASYETEIIDFRLLDTPDPWLEPFGTASFMQFHTLEFQTTAVAQGRPGTRQLGIIARKLRMGELGIIFQHGYYSAPLLLTPGYSHAHSFVHNVTVETYQRPLSGPLRDSIPAHYEMTPDVPSVLAVDLRVGQIPWGAFAEQSPNAIAATTGVYIPGRGYTFLGFGRALDDPKGNGLDGAIESELDEGGPAAGHVQMLFAPPHHGLNGYSWRSMVMASDIQARHGSLRSQTESIVFLQGRPKNGEAIHVDDFLQFAEGRYTQSNRLLQVNSTNLDADRTDVVRLRFACPSRQWHVLMASSAPTHSHTLPSPPQGFVDCTDSALVEVLDLEDAWSRYDLIGQGHNAGIRLDQVLSALSRQPVPIEPVPIQPVP